MSKGRKTPDGQGEFVFTLGATRGGKTSGGPVPCLREVKGLVVVDPKAGHAEEKGDDEAGR